MGDVTPVQALRFPWVDDVITDTAQGNLGADIAAKLTTQDAARVLVLQRPFVIASRNANQAIANNTDTTVIFDTATFDPNGVLNIAGTPTRITPGSALTGVWKWSIVPQQPGSLVKVQLSVLVTSVVKGYRTWTSPAAGGSGLIASGAVYVPTGTDFIEFKIKQNSGASQNISTIVTAWRHSA